jgi:hypothetical protein
MALWEHKEGFETQIFQTVLKFQPHIHANLSLICVNIRTIGNYSVAQTK